jgi:cytochrome b
VSDDSRKRVLVWDLPIRIFHWALVVLMVFSFTTGKIGGSWMKWHFWSGYAILTLLLFRILWGIVGSTTARFTQFVRGPSAGIEYLRRLFSGSTLADIGHNPVGGWMVVLLIMAVLLQAGTGLFTSDDIDTYAPLAEKVPEAVMSRLSTVHRLWINVILVLVGLHVLASLYYLVIKRQNLIGPMITGHKALPAADAPRLVMASTGLALALLIVCAGVVYFIVRLGG